MAETEWDLLNQAALLMNQAIAVSKKDREEQRLRIKAWLSKVEALNGSMSNNPAGPAFKHFKEVLTIQESRIENLPLSEE